MSQVKMTRIQEFAKLNGLTVKVPPAIERIQDDKLFANGLHISKLKEITSPREKRRTSPLIF